MTDFAELAIRVDSTQLSTGGRRLDELASKGERTERRLDTATSKMSGGFGSVASKIGLVTVAVGTVATALTGNQFLAFNRSLTEVSTLLTGTKIKIDDLESASKRLSAEFGTQPIEQTKAFYQIISAGAETAAEATDILTASNRLAVGGVTQVSIAADGLTSILNAYGDQVESAAAVSDTLFVGMKSGKTTIEELSSGLGKVTPLAASMNVGFDELTATIAALTKGGISTQESITGVRAVLAAVAKPTKEASDLAAKLGIGFDAAAIQTQGFAGFIEDVRQKTGGSTDSLSKLFGGVEALVPVMALAGQAGVDFNEILGLMANKVGATQEAVDLLSDSPGMQVDRLFSEISVASIELGAAMSTILIPAAKQTTNVLSDLREEGFFNSKVFNALLGPVVGFLREQAKDVRNSRKVLEDEVDEVVKVFEKLESTITPGRKPNAPTNNVITKSINESQRFIAALKKEVNQIGLTELEIRKLEAAKLGLSKVADPLIDKIEKENKALNDQVSASRELENDLALVESITRSVRTEQEIFADRQQELNRLMGIEGGISADTYGRALAQARVEVFGLQTDTEKATNGMSQAWIQANRSIQTSLANGIFNFFDDGLKGMVKGVISTVGRIASEFAALRLLQGFGFTGLASGSVGVGGGGSGGAFNFFDGVNLASAGNSIYQGFSGALAANAGSLIAGAGGLAGSGSSVAFGTALAGDSIGGLIAGTEAGLSGAAAAEAASAGSAGASGASASGPFAILGLATIIGNKLLSNNNELAGQNSEDLRDLNSTFKSFKTLFEGDVFGSSLNLIGAASAFDPGVQGSKLLQKIPGVGGFLGGTLDALIPDVGAFITKLFGRGPLKVKETNLIGQVNSEGFEGVTSTKLKAKGGVFASNKVERIIIDADSLELADGVSSKFDGFADNLRPSIELLNFTLDGAISLMNDSLSETSRLLGLGSTDGFSTNINIASAKGEFFTEEQITAELLRIETEFVRHVVPGIDSLVKKGETVVTAFARVGAEFDLLTSLGSALGNSREATQGFLREVDILHRSSFIDAAGGAEVLGQKIGFFADNFLTDAERLQPGIEGVSKSLTDLGLSSDLTKDEFSNLVRSFGQVNGISADLLTSLLELQSGFVAVRDASDQITQAERARNDNLIDIFATDAEKTGILKNKIEEGLVGLGLAADTTFDQLNAFARAEYSVSDGASVALDKLGLLAPLFLQLSEAGGLSEADIAASKENASSLSKSVTDSIFQQAEDARKRAISEAQSQVDSSFSLLRRSISAQRDALRAQFDQDLKIVAERIGGVSDSVRDLSQLADVLRDSTARFNPISVNEARGQIGSAIGSVSRGGSFDVERIKEAISTLENQSTSGFTTSLDFAKEQIKSSALIERLRDVTGGQLTLEQRTLSALESQKERLSKGFDDEIVALDSILSNAQSQLNTLNGIRDGITSTTNALSIFGEAIINSRNVANLVPIVKSVGLEEGFSNSDITDLVAANIDNPFKIYADAVERGISTQRIADNTSLFTLEEANNFQAENNLINLDIVHQLKQANKDSGEDNKQILKLLAELITAIQEGNLSASKTAKILNNAANGGQPLATEAVA